MRCWRSWTSCWIWSTASFDAASLCWPAALSSLPTRAARSCCCDRRAFCCERRSDTALLLGTSFICDSSDWTRSSSCDTRAELAALGVVCVLSSSLFASSAHAAIASAATARTPSSTTAVLRERIWSCSSASHTPSSSAGGYSRSRTRGGGASAGGRRRVGSSGGVDMADSLTGRVARRGRFLPPTHRRLRLRGRALRDRRAAGVGDLLPLHPLPAPHGRRRGGIRPGGARRLRAPRRRGAPARVVARGRLRQGVLRRVRLGAVGRRPRHG